VLIYEAAVLSRILDTLQPSKILDIGSGSRADREIFQPHIGAAFRGHMVHWADFQEHPGVTQCDITDSVTLKNLPSCAMVTAMSVLEHVTDIDAALKHLAFLVQHWLVVSVPHVYPEHHCPIDNLWRPTPNELGEKVESLGLHVEEAYLTAPETFNGFPGVKASLILARI
jgi:hypothetical protein